MTKEASPPSHSTTEGTVLLSALPFSFCASPYSGNGGKHNHENIHKATHIAHTHGRREIARRERPLFIISHPLLYGRRRCEEHQKRNFIFVVRSRWFSVFDIDRANSIKSPSHVCGKLSWGVVRFFKDHLSKTPTLSQEDNDSIETEKRRRRSPFQFHLPTAPRKTKKKCYCLQNERDSPSHFGRFKI